MRPRTSLALAASVAALGGGLFGYDTAVIAGAVGALGDHFGLGAASLGWVGASAIYGCLPGALLAGLLADRFGRRRLLLLCGLLYAFSGAWSAFPGGFHGFMAARFLGGAAIGMSSMVCPTYIAELAPERRRGLLGTLFQLGIVTGILLVFLVNRHIEALGDSAWNASRGWRWMLGSEALPALAFLGLLGLVPESPRWLLLRGRETEARAVLGRLFSGPEAHTAWDAMVQAGRPAEGRFRELLAPALRRPLTLAVLLAAFSQFSGINAILYYAPEVFRAAGASRNAAFSAAVWVGAVNLAFTLVALALVDRLGRRPLLIFGTSLQTLALVAVGWSFLAGPGPWTLVAVLVFIAAFAVAMGPIPWLLISEIFPGPVRGRAVAVGVGAIWTGCLVVTQTFPFLKVRLGPAPTFWIFAACSLLSLLYVLFRVPETKGRSLEAIAASWSRP